MHLRPPRRGPSDRGALHDGRPRTAGLAAAALFVAACGPAPVPAAPPAGGPAQGTVAAPAAAPAPPAPRPMLARDLTTPPPIEWTTHGAGAALRADDLVLVEVVGTLASGGRPFLDTRAAGAPIPHRVGSGQAVAGWDLVLPQLRVGDRVRTTIRSDLAYGDRGLEGVIPGRADLVYDIEVLSVVAPPKVEVLAKGEGAPTAHGKQAVVHYVATLPDGTEFDGTRKKGEPFAFRVGVGEVIEGWDWAVSRMRVGDRWKVVVPWVFAYGAEGSPLVPPKTDVTYDIEVLRVEE